MHKFFLYVSAISRVCLFLLLIHINRAHTNDVSEFHSLISIENTQEVQSYIDYLLKYPKASELLLNRGYTQFSIIEKKLDQANLPTDLKYLAVIESSMWPDAESDVGAVGLWQLMSSTAQELGLRIDNHIDERRDPVKSTEAAIDYLDKLFERYEDWALVIAAYNAGPGTVNNAISRAESNQFEKLKKFLPGETKRHVSKFVAAQYIFENQHRLGLKVPLPDLDKMLITKVNVQGGKNLSAYAKQWQLEPELLKDLNPAILASYVPIYRDSIYLNVPSRIFLENIDKEKPYLVKAIKISSNICLDELSRIYNVDPHVLYNFNLLTDNDLQTGQFIQLPLFNQIVAMHKFEEPKPRIKHRIEPLEPLLFSGLKEIDASNTLTSCNRFPKIIGGYL